MKFLIGFLGKKALRRWVNRKSPKVELAGGSVAAVVITGLLSVWIDPETAALLGANLGAAATTIINLTLGDDVSEPDDTEG